MTYRKACAKTNRQVSLVYLVKLWNNKSKALMIGQAIAIDIIVVIISII